MLFDLRGAGRRTTVKVVYLTLAVLMGGGLVLFGIGGDVSGGLVDAITERGAGSDAGIQRYQQQEAEAQRATQANPRDAEAWATLARARYQLARSGDGVDAAGNFTPEARAQLQGAAQAWERHLALDPAKPDATVASLMVGVYGEIGLNEPEKAVRAQEVITEARPGATSFARLAILAYQVGQTRKGDLARAESLRAAEDKTERDALKAELDQVKQQALAAQLQQGNVPDAGAGSEESGGGGGGGSGGGSGGGGGGSGGGGSGGGD